MSAVSRVTAARFGDCDEDRLSVLGRERTSRFGGAGLEQQRGALRRRAHQMRSFDLVPRPLVVDLVNLAEVGVNTGRTVLEQGVLLPRALPELVGHVDVLVRPGVSLVVLGQPVQPEVAGGVRKVVGDDVPRDPALAGVIKGGDAPGEVERMLLEDRGGERDAEVLGDIRDRAGEHRRIVAGHLEAGLEVLALITAVGRVEPDHVREEDGVELPPLQGLGEVHPVLEVVEVSLARCRAAPGALDDVASCVHHEGREVQRAWSCGLHGGHGGSPGMECADGCAARERQGTQNSGANGPG